MLNKEAFKRRVKIFSEYLKKQKIDCALIEDTESRRNSSLRYLTNFASDALLFVFADGRTILVPWDFNLAEKTAFAGSIKPYTDFGRNIFRALTEVIGKEGAASVELSENTPYPLIQELEETCKNLNFICKKGGMDTVLLEQRMIKDENEIEICLKASEITNNIFEKLEENILGNKFTSEIDAALFIESAAREHGAEGTGFPTLAAGPDRSFAIHAFPTFTNETLKKPGLSIIDFGIKYNGYTSDITFSIVRNPNPEQLKIAHAVEKAYQFAIENLNTGISTFNLSSSVEEYINSLGYSIPHALGHGIGLDAHEYPLIRNSKTSEMFLKKGMVITIEPGIYSKEHGGVRLENDFLITEKGYRTLTNSRILYC